jgi:hypothetical protein
LINKIFHKVLNFGALPNLGCMDDTIFLHVGLPKSASTFLQRKIFPELPVSYIHKSHDEDSMNFIKALRGYYRDESITVRRLIKSIPGGIRQKLGNGTSILVSDENLSISSMDLWNRTGCIPEQFADLTDQFAKSLNLKIRVLYVSRNIDTWLASRYAQSAPRFESPGQQDFEDRLMDISSDPDSYPVLNWLKDKAVKELFEHYSPNVSIGLTSQEAIATSSLDSLKLLFADSSINPSFFDGLPNHLWRPENKRSNGSGWVCRNAEIEIHLSERAKGYIARLEKYLEV